MSTATVSLTKGQKVDLTKGNPHLAKITIALGWDVNAGNGGDFDLDASAMLLDSSKKLLHGDSQNVIYFGHLNGQGVHHTGDNLTGAGDGDDETINVILADVPADCNEVLFVVNIYEAVSRRQNFGQVRNAFIRAYDSVTSHEMVKFDLSEDYSNFTAVIMGSIYRHDGEWKFNAVGEGRNGDLNAIIAAY